jgi:hypothetical protein
MMVAVGMALLLKDIQGAAKIVKHFKILVTCFSVRVSWRAGILT